tara:strand:- start:2640 stop:2996 length:357 start_codon:yes stop_codon:yes gene_type:complete
MPNLHFDYTDNIKQYIDFKKLALAMHQIIEDNLANAQVSGCKSFFTKLDNYIIADGDESHALIKLTLRILTGRDEASRIMVGKKLRELLVDTFETTAQAKQLQINVEVAEMPRQLYFK